jgi:hypothetical protein
MRLTWHTTIVITNVQYRDSTRQLPYKVGSLGYLHITSIEMLRSS